MKRRKRDIKTEREEALRGRILSLPDDLEMRGFGGYLKQPGPVEHLSA